jgi:AcrR family transcriptional regulator
MGRPLFDEAGFLEAARILASEHGPGAVTIDALTQRMKAPKGSFYHRFSSRDVLLGRLWLELVLAYQEGFVAAIEAGICRAGRERISAMRVHSCSIVDTISCRATGPRSYAAASATKRIASRNV